MAKADKVEAQPELLTITDVMRLLGYKSRRTIERKIRAGEFGKVTYLSTRTPRIPRSAFADYLANRTVISEAA